MTIDDATRRELARFGFDQAQLEKFAARLRDNPAEAAAATYVTGAIAPLQPRDVSVLPARGTKEHAALVERGMAALRAGEVGVVILAGGMATRFGGVVKAAVPVTGGKTFLGLKVADVAHQKLPVPIYVMTSFATHDRIDEQVREEKLAGVETFAQLVSVRLTPGGELFHEADGSLSPYATGHGDLTFALRASGVLRRFRERGGKLLFMSNVDNLGATLDAAIIGAHLAGGAAVTAEVVRKEKGDKGGAPARLDGVPQIIEAFRFPPSFDQDSIPLFNTNTFVFDAAAIDRDFDLTFFRVEKKVEDHKVIQFERLVGQLTAFLPSHFLEVPRSGNDGRFQPVKDPDELEARRSDIEHILRTRGILT
ncbi:MAG: UTP--glucose-1-phosphate uridylyltransferase [Deltaproteobacteria bacterium]|nr:UTP--glucose-1-phosphate uridylyltransferase [Deltaproteobacteria bacterium]